MSENKHQRFKRLAAQRTNVILDRIRVLGNCASKSSYYYTAEDINKIFNIIEKELKRAKGKFHPGEKDNNKFTL